MRQGKTSSRWNIVWEMKERIGEVEGLRLRRPSKSSVGGSPGSGFRSTRKFSGTHEHSQVHLRDTYNKLGPLPTGPTSHVSLQKNMIKKKNTARNANLLGYTRHNEEKPELDLCG